MRRFILVVIAVLCPVPASAWSTLESWADVVLLQWRASKPLPVLTPYDKALDLDAAYRIQRLVVGELGRQRQETVVGYRSDLTLPLSRARFRAEAPVTAVILKGQWLKPGTLVTRPPSSGLRLSPALGFVLGKAPSGPLETAAAAGALVAEVRPVVMFIDYNFDDAKNLRAPDLVAANGAPARVMVGAAFAPLPPEAVEATFIELHRGKDIIDRGKAGNLPGGQYEGLRWQVNELLRQGWTPAAGQLLVTGPLSEPVPADPGDYVADFWERGKVEFTVDFPLAYKSFKPVDSH